MTVYEQEMLKKVFPAGAGMNRVVLVWYGFEYGVPRRRGDEPALAAMTIGAGLCSPQARG